MKAKTYLINIEYMSNISNIFTYSAKENIYLFIYFKKFKQYLNIFLRKAGSSYST